MTKENKKTRKPVLINFHLHSTGSDGRLTPEQVVQEAVAAGINYMCFTDHYPEPGGGLEKGWKSDIFHSEEYKKEIKRLQEAYKNQIDIGFGVELDWFEEFQDWTKKEIAKNNFDFVIGSIHKLPLNGKYYSFDFGEAHPEKYDEVASVFGSVENLVRAYYEQLRLLIKSGMYDSVGHLDYIKRYNRDERLFSESTDFYKNEITKTLDEIAKTGMAMEINLRGLTKAIRVQYPSLWILKEARKRNIPITIGTDAHSQGQVADILEKGYELARQAGYKEIVRFKARKRVSIPI